MNHEPADAHLRAALHHAPGHDASPPAALDARVLARAHAATSTPWWRRLASAADGLMQPAPAAALATLVMATTTGLMWRGEVPPEALPTAPPQAVAPAPAPTTPVAAVSATSAAPAPTPTPRSAVVAQPAAPAAKARPAPAAEKLTRDEAVSPSVADAAPTPAPAPPALASATERSETRAKVTQAPAAAFAPRAAAMLDPFASVLQAMASDDPRHAAMHELQQVGQGRWQRMSIAAAATADSSATIDIKDANGRALGLLRLDDSAAWWQAADGSIWRAELPAPELAAIRARLGKGG